MSGPDLLIWNTATGEQVGALTNETGKHLWHVALSPDGRYVALIASDPLARIWNLEKLEEIASLAGEGTVGSVAFSPDGRLVATGFSSNDDSEHSLRIWDARTGKEIRTIGKHSDLICDVSYSADGKLVASGSWDRTVRIWDSTLGGEVGCVPLPSRCENVAFHPRDPSRLTLATGSHIWFLSILPAGQLDAEVFRPYQR